MRFQCCRAVSIYLVLRLESFEGFTFALAREIFFLVGGGGGGAAIGAVPAPKGGGGGGGGEGTP